ncbi:shikimate dehydrogenase [Puniceibacterium confluentis]|uniref:shikimate dehydrogenase n=1 Tax=Puniceibacterium confluentis TaxID=1958944 RepID=UPI003569D160
MSVPMHWMPMLIDRSDSDAPHVRVGLLGHGISASRTPRMHMAEGRAQGLVYDYHLIDLADCTPAPAIGDILGEIEAAGFRGLNVTYPYKQAVIAHLDTLSDNAQAVGAVNTVVFGDGARRGHNTDYWGFAESFRRGLPGVKRDVALLIGAGGAGGAVSAALLGAGIGRLMILDTNPDSAERLARSLCSRFGPGRAEVAPEVEAAAAQADGIVNASPVGMAKLPGLPLSASLITPRHWVADIVYFPLETELLATARAKGCAVLPGSGMALYQAVRAFELFTGLPADPQRMQATFDSFTTGSAT